MTPEDFESIVKRSLAAHITQPVIVPPKRVDWPKIVTIVMGVALAIGSLMGAYVVQMKPEAAEQHTDIKEKADAKFETKVHAEEVHDRHDEADKMFRRQMNNMAWNSFEGARAAGAPRSKLRKPDPIPEE